MSLFHRSSPGKFEFPGDGDRVTIVGTSGSGKSHFALWLVAESASYTKQPWVLVDYKGEGGDIIGKLRSLNLATQIDVRDEVPKEAGIYIVKPDPQATHLAADFLWKIYRRGRIGVFFDELSMAPEFRGQAGGGGPVKALLTQGRAKKIPVYGLVQRPVDVNIHAFSEASFLCEFYLKRRDDKIRIAEYLPEDEPTWQRYEPRLTKHGHTCLWWDDNQHKAFYLKPAPDVNAILDIFETRIDKAKSSKRL